MRCPCCGAKLLLTADSAELQRQRRNALVVRWKQRNRQRYRDYQRQYYHARSGRRRTNRKSPGGEPGPFVWSVAAKERHASDHEKKRETKDQRHYQERF